MALIDYIENPIKRIIDFAGAGLGAATLSQGPGFISAYTQNVAGALKEATISKEHWQNLADQFSGGSLEKLANLYSSSKEALSQKTGNLVEYTVDRFDHLSNIYQGLTTSDMISSPINFVKNFDPEIAKSAIDNYALAINLTPEGICYAGVGALGGYFITKGLRKKVIPAIKSGIKYSNQGAKDHCSKKTS